MEDVATKGEGSGTTVGPVVQARYLPLYRAMRKCMSDEGYAPGYKGEEALLRENVAMFKSLEIDMLIEYVQQATSVKAPIDFACEADYVEKIWFCPIDETVSTLCL